jgi:D-glutamate cyclase
MSSTRQLLDSIRDIVQHDIGARGLRNEPNDNLITACPGDFAAAAHSLAVTEGGTVGILTGFFIPHAQPPCGETDGPIGAVFLARALVPLGFQVVIYTDQFCMAAVDVGLRTAGLESSVNVIEIVPALTPTSARARVVADKLTHLISVERVGPCHTEDSIRAQPANHPETLKAFLDEVPLAQRDRLRNMRGLDITHLMAPGHLLVEAAGGLEKPAVTIGIGDGGNEIGMGKIPWQTIHRNIARGGAIACRTATTHLIVAGISNWGAYGLGFAVHMLRQGRDTMELLSESTERAILQAMIERGPLVDGVSGQQTMSVDGVPFNRYIAPLRSFQELLPKYQ